MTTERLTYVRATENDWQTVSVVEKSVGDARIYKAITQEREVKEYIRTSCVYIIFLGTNIIGTISYEEKDAHHAYFDGIVILPEYQHKGYASQTLRWVLKALSSYTLVDLATHPHNTPAIKLYLSCGFVIDGWKDNYFGDGEPRIIMKRSSPA